MFLKRLLICYTFCGVYYSEAGLIVVELGVQGLVLNLESALRYTM